MKYILPGYLEENGLTEDEREHCYEESAQLRRDLKIHGQCLNASPLHPASAATNIRVRDTQRFVTNGPYDETREQLRVFFLVDARNLDDAIGIASRIPEAGMGTIEVRPVMAISGLPVDSRPLMEVTGWSIGHKKGGE